MNTPVTKETAAPSRLGVWLHHHGHSVVFSLGRAWRKPWATLLTVMVMALALALPLGLSIARLRARKLAFWVPLSAGVVSFVLLYATMFVVVLNDPTLVAAITPN